jgi:hypothetical protein
MVAMNLHRGIIGNFSLWGYQRVRCAIHQAATMMAREGAK